jgi:hypothetical protein
LQLTLDKVRALGYAAINHDETGDQYCLGCCYADHRYDIPSDDLFHLGGSVKLFGTGDIIVNPALDHAEGLVDGALQEIDADVARTELQGNTKTGSGSFRIPTSQPLILHSDN